jgi:hypothetical protein
MGNIMMFRSTFSNIISPPFKDSRFLGRVNVKRCFDSTRAKPRISLNRPILSEATSLSTLSRC